ncbi:V-type ATPase 116kDa subunit family protein [Natronococcus amylolyticus]|nr:V-type ATPase 116kDa subunit family protein [Natronococcus amylolyticus]
MFRPERMSKVSVAGSKGVMPTVIETIHNLNLVHLSDYDGSWKGFDNGTPIEGADDASEKLVTVRALESTLDLSADETTVGSVDDGWEQRLEETRTRVNELDDDRSEIREELRQVEERLDRVEPFAELEVDLDLLSGYETVDVVVGEGPADEIEAALEMADEIRAFETFTGGDVVAIVAAPAEGVDADDGLIDDALVGVEFTRHEIPETDRTPGAYVAELEEEKQELQSRTDEIDAELEQIKANQGGFLLALEAELTVEVQRAEAPLQFATSDRAFIAEGWIPTEQYEELVAALRDTVGESVEIEELERAEYDEHEHGAVEHTDDTETEADADADSDETSSPKQKAATDGGQPTRADGGGHGNRAVTMDNEPPVRLDNITPAKPFELLVKMVSQPKYSELDPTFFIFLTYPFAFGFMIGDIGYGILYMLMGWGAWKIFDSDAGKAIGTIAIWAGVFTILFGYLYDDFFGVYMSDVGIHLPLAGVLTKGLQHPESWAMLWIVMSVVFGVIHLNIGLVLGFINELSHSLKAAVMEKFSWILAMNGLFLWLFSTHGEGQKPDFLVGTESVLYETDQFALGFEGLPEVVGLAGIAMLVVGVVMVGSAEGVAGLLETPAWAFGHVLSYLRMVAVLLAKGGMAFVVNLLVFGAAADETGYMEFAYFGAPAAPEAGEVVFEGLVWIGFDGGPIVMALALIGAVVVFVLGHIVVLLLGITAAGIQMLRLEYVEFFQKFYDGGGEEYDPFGHDSQSDGQPAPQAD